MNLNILILPRYGPKAASSRHRFYQFLETFKSNEFDCTMSPFFGEEYLDQRFEGKSGLLPGVIQSYKRRIIALMDKPQYDIIFVHFEFFPGIPAPIELGLLPKGIPYIYDFDDAWFHHYDDHTNPLVRILLRNKISRIIKGASSVIAGSKYLSDFSKKYNENVNLIPTSIDLKRYPDVPPIEKNNSPFTVGWIGSPSTTVYLKEVESPLAEFCSKHNAKVVLIGASQIPLKIPNLYRVRWQEEIEIEEMSKFDVGIMPMPDTPFTRGKCAFKLIQYMGCWKPVIASPFGENLRVVEENVNGIFAQSPMDWIFALERLLEDKSLRIKMGTKGRRKVENNYSLQINAPRLIRIIERSQLSQT